jgi:hypothetical protein
MWLDWHSRIMGMDDHDQGTATRPALADQVGSHAHSDPRLWIEAAKAASQAGRASDAEALLQEATRRFPDEPASAGGVSD